MTSPNAFRLVFVFYAQAFVLAAWGGILCLHAIQAEKDLNTFDFQRFTRLTSLELVLGKLFGAPVMAYFIAVCLLPAALAGALVAWVPLILFLVALLILFVGTVSIHAIALFVSLIIQRRAASAAVLGFLVVVLISPASPWNPSTRPLSSIGSFYAAAFVQSGTINPVPDAFRLRPPDLRRQGELANLPDSFFGARINHLYLMFGISLSLTGWFLLGVKRNIKRDPGDYEYFTPFQLLGLVYYIAFLNLGFYSWAEGPANNLEVLHFLNIFLIYGLGLGLLRNCDRVRRALRAKEAEEVPWLSATWPAGYMVLGAGIVELAAHVAISRFSVPTGPWNAALATFSGLFFVLWAVRDLLFMQWMNLRREKNPLALAWIYLLVYYSSAVILLNAFDVILKPRILPWTAVFVPTVLVTFDVDSWNEIRAVWIFALVMQAVAALLFGLLQKHELDRIVLRSAVSAPLAAD